MKSLEFLLTIWGIQCNEGDFVALSSINAAHDSGTWKDVLFPYNDQLESSVADWLERHVDDDVYFCPLPFTKRKRAKNFVARSHFLWSDIDNGDYKLIPPSILWESSPGRFQGLWRVDELTPAEAAEQSRSLAYRLGADKGGWDLTQVLRIPGTRNFKYDPPPTVTLHNFSTKVQHISLSVLDKYRKTIPRKILRILEGPAEQGKRSDMIWYLEHELCDLGIPVDDAIEIIRETDWNKYRGRADEEERFRTEVEKITGDREVKGAVTRVESRDLIVIDYASMMMQVSSQPGWLVKNWWLRGSQGMIAGEPKSFKSTLLMDMLFCVAADTKFLDNPVEHAGAVLIIQNENSDWIMQDRLEKLALKYGETGTFRRSGSRIKLEWARNLPIFFINQQGFSLDDAADRVALEQVIQQIKPVAICLDPLYQMFAGDVNSAQDLNPVLNWCQTIRQDYRCAVILVHHYNKGGEGKRGGQRMLGSTTLHAWNESAWYIQANEPVDAQGRITVDREFRGATIYDKVDLGLTVGGFGDPTYNVQFVESGTSNAELAEQILGILETYTNPMSKTAIAKQTGLSRRVVDGLMDQLESNGIVTRKGERYLITPPLSKIIK